MDGLADVTTALDALRLVLLCDERKPFLGTQDRYAICEVMTMLAGKLAVRAVEILVAR